MTISILDRIKAYKLQEIAARKATRSLSELEQAARDASPVRPFDVALDAAAREGFALIAEIKKASPSRGVIRTDFSPLALARAYEAGGAACLSVLTDEPSFQGNDQFLSVARKACTLPVLRKDFLYDPYQVVEARALGADCILIIMASVSDAQANELENTARSFGMQVVLEVHNESELARALTLKSRLLGINNRDLKTFNVSLEVTHQLAADIPPEYRLISESGIFTHDDMENLAQQSGVRRFLVGESLMRQSDVKTATRLLLSGSTDNG